MRITVLILISLAASSCAEPGPPPQRPDAVAQGHRAAMTSPSPPVVELATYRSNGLTASGRPEGILAIVDGCIMQTSPSHPDGVFLFFPEGQARWNGEDRSLTIAGERFRLGDRIWLTGGLPVSATMRDGPMCPDSARGAADFSPGEGRSSSTSGACSLYTSTDYSTGLERRSLSRSLTLAAFAVLAQGCEHPEQELGSRPEAPLQQEQVAMPEPERATTGMRLSYWGVGLPPPVGPVGGAAARLDGILSRRDGCLVVDLGEGRALHPVFPAGKAVWDEASGTLRLAGKSYRPGDRITLGGGGAAPAFRGESGVEIAPCEVSDLWVVIA
jgi:hypothetical protein